MTEINDIINKLKNNEEISGIVRKIDELGRIVIPIEYRKKITSDKVINVAINSVENYIVIEILDDEQEDSQKLDELGRVLIKMKLRNLLEWKEKDSIEIWSLGKYIILKKVEIKEGV